MHAQIENDFYVPLKIAWQFPNQAEQTNSKQTTLCKPLEVPSPATPPTPPNDILKEEAEDR